MPRPPCMVFRAHFAAAKLDLPHNHGKQQSHPISLPEHASMQLSRLLLRIALLLLPVALLGTTWLYLYPIFHGCGFPTPPTSHAQPLAPFRLLSLGDPQLEGDSSLPDPNALVFPSVEYLVDDLRAAADFAEKRDIVKEAAKGVVKDALKWLEGKRKAIDLWGNDWYLAHIVRSLRWWTQPTHISVLGDLLGSQWVTDGEFSKRAGRYWNVVMRGLEKVPDAVFGIEEVEVSEEVVETREEAIETKAGEDGEGKVEDGEAATVVEQDKEAEAVAKQDEEAEAIVEQDKETEGKGGGEEAGVADSKEEHSSEQESKERDDEAQDKSDDGEAEEPENKEEKPERKAYWGGTKEVLGADKDWEKRVINIAGNHDVGYAGDIDQSRIERFERAFGSVNWDIWFTLPETLLSNETADVSKRNTDRPPTLRLVVLNSMNLDAPAWSPDLQTETYNFMNHIITGSLPVSDKTHATILLTHIPLEKEAGICVDSPYFDYFESGHGVKEQNMLSDHSTKTVLEGIFGMSWKRYVAGLGMGRRGIIINGHDHAGCDVVHYIRQRGVEDGCRGKDIKLENAYLPARTANDTMLTASMEDWTIDVNRVPINETLLEELGIHDAITSPESSTDSSEPAEQPTPEPEPPTWRARRFPHRRYEISSDNECTDINASPHIREITLRSMMGEYSGYAGFLSAWFDEQKGERGEWVFEFSTCGLGIQHWWWGIHVVDLILVIALLGAFVAGVVERSTVLTDGVKQERSEGLEGKERKVFSGSSGRTAMAKEVVEKRI
ncbi:hypothetical protein yc1106_03619 [Curvularia clavata]|uniref:Calcineurin-like phosphoesterase domain-containing protein n=1 Tax=Curvularia clavata TaxID=95742 RepID=A0A9Q9DRS5_CURCL|nr:hypothetical protein yc1106_03619 [Curvularia clavata]